MHRLFVVSPPCSDARVRGRCGDNFLRRHLGQTSVEVHCGSARAVVPNQQGKEFIGVTRILRFQGYRLESL